ncbi:methylosome protein 50-like [Phthorimaea operculella]|nr:methylosome protein 50-like [Phthorimaea operculella]
MENSNRVIPPHLNAEIYRTNVADSSSGSSLDYIHLHKDGSVLVGCSELTGRYWNGGVAIYKDIAEAQKQSHQLKKDIPLNSGTNDGCFIDGSNKVLLCEDNGTLSVWGSLPDDAWKTWTQEVMVAEHDEAILAVDCLDPGQEYVTAGADGNVKVWDINDLICIRNYGGAHNMAVSGVASKPNSKTSFATASLDSYVTLWDDNVAKPVIDIIKNDCGVRCLQWVDENKIVYGDEAGALRIVDVRNTETKQDLAQFPAPVHRIAVHYKSDKVAVCCDNKIVTVCTLTVLDGPTTLYQDRLSHTNYVRGAAWDHNDQNILYTTGWDGEIKSHTISS